MLGDNSFFGITPVETPGGDINTNREDLSRVDDKITDVLNDEEDDMTDLIQLIAELNAHQDLNMKLHNHTKIISMLDDVTKPDIDYKVKDIMN